MKTYISLALGCALAASVPAFAQSTAGPAEASEEAPAIAVLQKEFAADWDESQRGQLIYIGYYRAAAHMCDGLDLDREKLAKVVNESLVPDLDKHTPEEQENMRRRTISHVALATGAFLGVHANEQAAFCARAKAQRDASPESGLFK